jgi:hypothetical protein
MHPICYCFIIWQVKLQKLAANNPNPQFISLLSLISAQMSIILNSKNNANSSSRENRPNPAMGRHFFGLW